jgi:hypothetical protein
MALSAFARCGIRRTELLAQHMEDAFLESNYLQSSWAADGITFWTVALNTQLLTAGVATYTVPANAITVLDVYIVPGTAGLVNNRLIFPFSRTDFASLGNPQTQGFPTSYWVDRVIPQTITLWPVPDASASYTMNYYTYNQIQDASLRNGTQPQIQFWWIDAYIADLAHRLSRIYAPQMEQLRKADKMEAYQIASKQAENVDFYITPGLSGYFSSGGGY